MQLNLKYLHLSELLRYTIVVRTLFALCYIYMYCAVKHYKFIHHAKLIQSPTCLHFFLMNVPVDFHIRYVAPSLRCPLHSILISHPKCHS